MTDEAKREFEAISAVHAALAPLDDNAKGRVINYILSLLGLSGSSGPGAAPMGSARVVEPTAAGPAIGEFASFAELFDAARPETNAELALVAGYWLQVCEQSESFGAQSATKELANLGYKVANITKALTDLKELKPALILQLKKSGPSQQARKTYKVSVAGIRRVEEMIRG